MDYKKLLFDSLLSEKYYTNIDLRMNRKYGFLLSNQQLDEYLKYKEENNDLEFAETKIEIPLKSWNSKKIFFYFSNELISVIKDYSLYLKDDYVQNKSIYVIRNITEVAIGMLCSELEGTLKIEGVNTTRRQIEHIITNNINESINDKIINNMNRGFNFIIKDPEFNKDNLKKLYDILSDGCLTPENEIKDLYYRYDKVYISNHSGCPADRIDECMNSLFDFVNNSALKDDRLKILGPYIAHYYLLYIHPYFDYNGRTARMVQLWLLIKNGFYDIFLSEAINDNKNAYYTALDDSRNSHNDLTYFLTYLFRLCNKYIVIHKNLEKIKSDIESTGESISDRELHYLKRIIINKKIGWFNFKRFNEFQDIDITKAGALKILNKFEGMGLLISKINKSNEKVFIFNEDILEYELK